MALVLAGLPLYVFPAVDEVRNPQIVYVIGPPTHERMEIAREILEAYPSAELLVSVGREGWGWSSDDVPECHAEVAECVIPKPFTTGGETLALADFAARADGARAVIVTFAPHVARARHIFSKCYGNDVAVVASESDLSPLDWAYQYAYQTAAWVKAVIEPCP